MSYKTDRLVALFPQVYGAAERSSLLHKLLDAIGGELMDADAAVKRLLKSHWVQYAEDDALDRLASGLGVQRRRLASGALESDAAFRARLQSVVSLYTGGGTVEAVKGAVRSALGLPYNLDQLNLPPAFAALRADIDALVQVHEFSPKVDRVLENTITVVDAGPRAKAARLTALVNASTVQASQARIELTVDRGTLTMLSVVCEETGAGFRSNATFALAQGSTVVFSGGADGRLSALLDGGEVASQFTALDGSVPAAMPTVPAEPSHWQFQAQGGLFDQTRFDRASVDLPQFRVAISRIVFEPLTFDVEVPFFLQDAVRALQKLHGYTGEVLVFEGIAPDRIQEVVDQTRAAGVRGAVQFALHFVEDQAPREDFHALADGRFAEQHDADELLTAGNTNDYDENHDQQDRLTIAGVFDVSRFEGPFGFM